MKARKIGRGLGGAGGVALADILANSVAVMLILIFLSVSVKQEQAEQQVEQTVDISILMARKLASSVVLNALPNSKPAYLHDYHSCAIQHDCQPNLLPVIEIYDDFTRILNVNQVVDRKAMLQKTNVLDEYLAGLDSHQLHNIRVDIYGIGMFYLTVATLREFKAPLKHWHFLGERASAPGSKGKASSSNNRLAQLLEQGLEGLEDSSSNEASSSTGLPHGVDVVNPSDIAGLEEENLLLPPEEIGAAESASNNQGEGPGKAQKGDLLNQLLNDFDSSRNQRELAQSGSRRFQLRLPNVIPPQSDDPLNLDLDPEKIELLMLTFLLKAMEDARANNFFDPNRLGAMFAGLVKNPESYTSYEHYPLVRDISGMLVHLSQSANEKIKVVFEKEESKRPVALALSPNSAARKIVLSGEKLLEGQEDFLSEGASQVDVLMRLYPFVYRGDRASVSSDTMVLMHPDEFLRQGERWLPIALVSHDLQQMTLGFIYGTFKAGKLLVPVDVNQVRAQSVVLQTGFGSPPHRLSWQIASAFIISGLLLLFILGAIIQLPQRVKRS